ncbi:PREDICTED: protein tyrosine phosphatase type IVA 3 isoform X2 [Nestor notabilis]|uniref:Protein tyrosine phosphatase 4A3 n=1 Tax=Cyanoderma ruficeps TaxID=181631 RepID=A0A8C3QWP8_9PASS|nr:PREDICTED: protein tyrosine phosphatase type IVA 3 isoform X2 [Acanthisitta chloris]XP_009864034.1 PREDICTED: protein tyrosine phosphatase type IVA 3 isoform X2 [Apaloderma vittatum]XP_009886469.1 PREDICTED: protein tyrosine phosphatase type IVA 3 isoform X2 [Charadrius vociferus]XP_009994883.1 PREDICTED: protein tyrosine phosphatase type IVA 3 isoform X2 [Chaetura pelagica]XP_010018291.1 PREDICTED: protein tyrosine phosphatase type IVA 3 isoform X2 [Nestor notabilis]XP_010150110.1 PREDICTE
MARMNRPAPVEVCYKNMRFLITHNPTNATLNTFLEDLKKYGATTVVRVCEVTYDKTPLEKDGITVMDWPFDDGAPPPSKIVEDWLNLLKTKFCEDPGCCVAVHCVAGLGRKRRGAINSKQLTYLEKYRPKQRLRFKDPHNHKNKCCIM